MLSTVSTQGHFLPPKDRLTIYISFQDRLVPSTGMTLPFVPSPTPSPIVTQPSTSSAAGLRPQGAAQDFQTAAAATSAYFPPHFHASLSQDIFPPPTTAAVAAAAAANDPYHVTSSSTFQAAAAAVSQQQQLQQAALAPVASATTLQPRKPMDTTTLVS